MHLYRLTYYPDGLLESERMDIDELNLAPFESLFSNGLSFNSPIPSQPDVSVKWTGMPEGQANAVLLFRE